MRGSSKAEATESIELTAISTTREDASKDDDGDASNARKDDDGDDRSDDTDGEKPKRMSKADLQRFAASIVDVIIPVTLCMMSVVLAIRTVGLYNVESPTGEGVSYVYVKADDDSTESEKLSGAFINTLIIISLIIVATFVLVICVKCGWFKILSVVFMVSTVIMLGFFGGSFFHAVLTEMNQVYDWISICFLTLNFAAPGIIAIHWKGPLVIQQMYLVFTAVLMALVLVRFIPAWTVWVLLGGLCLWDLVAVLCPAGPLKMLINNIKEKNIDLPPSLIYSTTAVFLMMANPGDLSSAKDDNGIVEHGEFNTAKELDSLSDVENAPDGSTDALTTIVMTSDGDGDNATPENVKDSAASRKKNNDASEKKKKRGEDISKRKGVQLGMGDFVFYSVLMGRASVSNSIAVPFCCFFGIITGLCLTLLLLGLFGKALPALPISITFGIIMFFLVESIIVPFTDSLSSNLIFL